MSAAAGLTQRSRAVRALTQRPEAGDSTVRAAAIITVVTGLWFAFGPGSLQLLGIQASTPILAGLTAAGMWRVGADRRLPAAATRFWMLLALALFMFTAGMTVDFLISLGLTLDGGEDHLGKTLLFPVAGLFAVVALGVYPTSIRSRTGRVKVGLDIAIVLFACATFVWYLLGSRDLHPEQGIQGLADPLVLPALIVVAGFAVLRITLAGAGVIGRPTMTCFVFAAFAAASSIFLAVPADSGIGRFGSWIQVVALSAVVLGVSIQRHAGLVRRVPPVTPGWRRPLSFLPYVALLATVLLLFVNIAPLLDHKLAGVAIGVLALTTVVIFRQYVSLWENSKLLAANGDLTRQLHHSAYHDTLTTLANRGLFVELVRDAIARSPSSRSHQPAVLFIDLDDFKDVNDGLGHHIGDEVLIAVAQRLLAVAPPEPEPCRLGGDEFAILVPRSDEAAAVALAEEVLAALAEPFVVAGIEVRMTASIGVALAVGTADELLRNADMAMYAAKRTGGGVRAFHPDMLRQQRLRSALVRAVERDEFDVLYEPIADLATGRVVGARAVARWRRPNHEYLWPREYRPLAEETGVIADIDQLVLGLASLRAARWQQTGAFALHVPVSGRQLRRAQLVDEIDQTLAVTGLPASRLTLELDLGAVGPLSDDVVDRLRTLGALGVRLTIDDLDVSYASLRSVGSIPAESITIAPPFVATVLKEVAPLARSLVALATGLGLSTVAAGVECPDQARRLVELGCRRGHGPLFGEPMEAAEFEGLLGLTESRPVATTA